MLESMRAVQNTWIGKAFMAMIFVLIIVGLSFFGFADLFRTYTGNWIARVGGTDISVDEFRQAYQTNLQQLQQRLRRPITNEQARQYGLDQQVLSRLMTDAVLDNEANRLGLGISNPQIAQAITDDPTFAGSGGQFDRARFASLLRDNGMTEQSFVRDQRKTYMRQEIVDAVAGAIAVPKAALEALHRFQAETRSIDMIVLQPSVVGDIPAPDDAALQKYFDERKQSFAAPEYRKLVLLAVTPLSVANPGSVTDEDIQKRYNTVADSRFGTSERRTLQQIVFPSDADAQAAEDRIKTGTSFADIATERKVAGKDLDLGTVTKGELFDKAVADAAFALPADGTSEPIKGTFGTVLVHVTAIEPGSKKPLEEVSQLLRQEIATEPARTRDALRDIRDKIEDQRTSGKTLTEAATQAGLTVRTIDAVDASGHDKAGAVVDIPDQDAVLRAVFASDIGVDNDVIQTRSGDAIWFEVASIDPAHQRSFAEVKPAVEAAWRADETTKRLSAKADDLVKSVASGTTMEQVAASLNGSELKHVGDLRRTGTQGVPDAVALKAFDTPVGSAGSAEGGHGMRVLFNVIDSVVPTLDPDTPESKQIEEQYRNSFSDEVLTAYLTRLESTSGVKVNTTALQSAVGGSN